jgi:hypothetical protein
MVSAYCTRVVNTARPAAKIAISPAQQAAKSAAGHVSKLEVEKHEFDAAEMAAVQERVRAEATSAALEAYKDAIAKGQPPKDANKIASSVAINVGRQAAKAEAVRAAEVRAENVIATGTTFDTNSVDADGRKAMVGYQAGKIGVAGKRLAVELEGKTEQEFNAIMQREVASGEAKHSIVKLVKPIIQDMDVYEYDDGTVVRRKPVGDQDRKGPTFSVEVKKDSNIPHDGPTGTAIKLDSKGRAVPKGPTDVANPYKKGTAQYDAFLEHVMNAGHRELKE